MYRTIAADPPWPYEDRLTMSATKRGAASHYAVMSIEEICGLYTPMSVKHRQPVVPGRLVGHEIADVAFLWLWTTKDHLLSGDAVKVCEAWGFEPKQIVPWVKGRVRAAYVEEAKAVQADLVLQTGMGRITRNVVEYLIIGTRGKYSSRVQSKSENGLILTPRSSHSTKPDEAYALIERVCPGPYLELFARRPRPGWTVWGDAIADVGPQDRIMASRDVAGVSVDRLKEEDVPLPFDGPAPFAARAVITDVTARYYPPVLPDTPVEWS